MSEGVGSVSSSSTSSENLVKSPSSGGVELSDVNSPQKKEKKEKDKKDQVAKQTESLNTPGTIWYAIKTMDVDSAMKAIEENPKVLYERGAVGDTPLHLCFLFNQPQHLAIARTLITKYPEVITVTYDSPIYNGETVLHIAIVNKDLETVKWLVEREKKLLTMPADGKFFQGESPCYYGEYPLSFAACTNNIPMVKYLLEAGADMFKQDSSGNNVLHMCVIHNAKQMYEWLFKQEKQKIESGEYKGTPMAKMKNKDGFTPLTLAAKRGETEMFSFIFESSVQTQWTYGPVSCNCYPLEELDTIQFGEKQVSALEIIVRESHLDLLMLPRVISLLQMKWDSYAERYFYKRCLQAIFYVLILTIACILRSPNFHYTDSAEDVGRAIAEVLVLLGWLYKGFKEGRELLENGLGYFQQTGSALLENYLSVIHLVSLFIAVMCQIGESRAMNFFLFVAVLSAWTYLLTLLLGFALTGPFVIMLWKMWKGDIARFFVIYIIVLAGHAVAFFSIQNATLTDPETGEESTPEIFEAFFSRLQLTFLVLLQQIDFDGTAEMTVNGYQWMNALLLFIHVIFTFIMILNILIAMIGDTYGEVKDNAEREWRLAFAQIIFSIESEMPHDQLRQVKYWTVMNDQRYLQVEEVNAEHFKIVTESLADVLKSFDTNNDGIIDKEELEAGERKLMKQASLARIDDEHRAGTDFKDNLGTTDVLKGRLDPTLTS